MELCRPPPPRPSARPSASLRLLLTVLQKPSGWLTTHPRGDHPPDRSRGGQPGRGWRWERGWGGGSTAGTVRLEPQQQAKPAVGEKTTTTSSAVMRNVVLWSLKGYQRMTGVGRVSTVSQRGSPPIMVSHFSHTASLRLASALHSLSSNSVGHF